MTKINKEWLDIYFSYGVDKQNRCIFLCGEVDEASISNVIKGLYLMESEDSQKPIELRIMSNGGNIYNMFGLHDVTRTLKCPVHTMGIGSIMSAAVLLLACGEKGHRWAGPNTSFMVHVPWADWGEKKTTEALADVKFLEEIWSSWYDLMGKYTNMPAKHWKKLCSKPNDFYFTAEQALEWGIIDELWDEKDGV